MEGKKTEKKTEKKMKKLNELKMLYIDYIKEEEDTEILHDYLNSLKMVVNALSYVMTNDEYEKEMLKVYYTDKGLEEEFNDLIN